MASVRHMNGELFVDERCDTSDGHEIATASHRGHIRTAHRRRTHVTPDVDQRRTSTDPPARASEIAEETSISSRSIPPRTLKYPTYSTNSQWALLTRPLHIRQPRRARRHGSPAVPRMSRLTPIVSSPSLQRLSHRPGVRTAL